MTRIPALRVVDHAPAPAFGRDALEALPIPAVVLTRDTWGIDVNQMAVQLLGHPDRATLVEMPWDEVWPDTRARRAVFTALAGGRGIDPFTARVLKYNGRFAWVEVRVAEIEYTGDRGWLAILTDVTDRQHHLDHVAQRAARFQSLFQDSPVALWHEDFTSVERWFDELRESGVDDLRSYLTGHPTELDQVIDMVEIRDANRKGRTMMGLDPWEAVPSDLELLDPSEVAAFREELIGLWEGATDFSAPIEHTMADGSRFRGEIHLTIPLIDDAPDLSSVIVALARIGDQHDGDGG